MGYFTFMLPCIVIDFFLSNQPDALIIQIYSVIKLYTFRTSSLPIIRSSVLYIRRCFFLKKKRMGKYRLDPGIFNLCNTWIYVRRFKPLLSSQEKWTRCQVAGSFLGQTVAMNTTEQRFCPRQVSKFGHPAIRNLVVLLTVVLVFVVDISSNNILKLIIRPIKLRRSWQFWFFADRI